MRHVFRIDITRPAIGDSLALNPVSFIRTRVGDEFEATVCHERGEVLDSAFDPASTLEAGRTLASKGDDTLAAF